MNKTISYKESTAIAIQAMISAARKDEYADRKKLLRKLLVLVVRRKLLKLLLLLLKLLQLKLLRLKNQKLNQLNNFTVILIDIKKATLTGSLFCLSAVY